MRIRLALLSIAIAAVCAVPAGAADHNATLSHSATSFAWEGAAASSLAEPGLGLPVPSCGDGIMHCEDVLLNIETPGELAVTLESPDGMEGPDCMGSPCASGNDFDGYIYKSNAAGEPQGDPLGETDTDCSSSYPNESCKQAVETGHYLIRVVYFLTFEAAYKGTATLTPSGPAPAAASAPPPATAPPAGSPPPPPPAQSQPAQSQPAPSKSQSAAAKKKKLKACQKKAKKKKNAKKRKAALKRCAKKFR